MKRGKVLMAVLVVMAVLFASCSNGLSEGDAAVAKLAPVNLTVNFQENGDAAQKAMSLERPDDGYTYWVKATATWTSTTAHNDFSDWTRIAYSGANSDIGYFTPGTWTFDVHIMAGNAEATTYDVTKVVYAGSTTSEIAIGTATTVIPITVSKYNDSDPTNVGTGTVLVGLSVPAAAKSTGATPAIIAPDVTIQYGSVSEASISNGTAGTKVTGLDKTTTPYSIATTTTDATNWYYFTNTYTGLAAGIYTFNLKYYDKDHSNGGQQIGGSTFAFTVRSGETYQIYGTIENGEYQIAQMTLTMPEVVTVEIGTTAAAEVNPGTAVTYNVDTTKTTSGATFEWFVNGKSVTADTDPAGGTAYTLPTTHPGIYEVTCKATKGDSAAYHTKTIKVVPPVIIISRVGDAGANVSTITTAQTLVCRPSVYIPGATYKWYVGTDTANATTGNSYSFTNGSDGTYVINCQAIDGSNNVIRVGSKSITVE